jgi:hypothetical protein
MTLVQRLWTEETGSTQPMAAILMVVLLCIGAIVGLTTVRDQLVQEFGDVCVALESLDQSFSGFGASYADPPNTLVDPPNDAPACINIIGVQASAESDSAPVGGGEG